VTEHKDQLREAFETHEDLAPDPAEVYARVQELARGYRWRRRTAQAAGGAVLGAGLIAGAFNMPALLSAIPHGTVTVATAGAPAAPLLAPSPSSTPSDADLQKDWDAYFAAGYGYDDAVKLAQIWNTTADIGTVKAEAGRRLLAGETLPIAPGPETTDTVGALEGQQVDAFFAAGYTYGDAVTLAALWHTVDPYHAKIEGGKRLLAGQTLPIRP
jgi:hypothetical protein